MSGWQFKNLDEARSLISKDPIGSPSIDFKPIQLGVAPNLSFPGSGGLLAINPRGLFTLAVLNDAGDVDEDGLMQRDEAEIADGQLPPQVRLGDGAWLKFRVEVGVKATGAQSVGDVIGIDAEGEFGVVFTDYHRHDPAQPTREAFLADIREARFATNRDDVEGLAPGETLAFRRSGAVRATVTVRLSDLFTGQIGTLGKLLGTAAPIAIAFKAGATITAEVSVDDDFIIAFSRLSENSWRAGVRKARTSRFAPSIDGGVSVEFADPELIEKLLGGVVDGVLGTPLAQLRTILDKASLEDLSALERRLATFVMERIGLEPAFATLQQLRDRVAEIEETAVGFVRDVAAARIALSFTYEYNRIDERVNLVQVTLDRSAVGQLHGEFVRGRLQLLAERLAGDHPGIELECYLNQKALAHEHSWGFTLSFTKWAALGGRDFKHVKSVKRVDVQERVQESYLGARGYKGSWAGESFEWKVDLKADMKSFASEPRVNDFSFGIYLAWVATQRRLSASELEQWLDLATIWGVLDAAGLAEIRGRMARAIGRDAQISVHIVVPNAVLRSVLPLLSVMPATEFAGAFAAAMPWMEESPARSNAAERRSLYAPLWATALGERRLSMGELAGLAADRVRAEGHPELVVRETRFLDMPDPFSFAGLVRLNGDTRGACLAFARGARILQSAIDSGARNQKTIDKAVREMNDLWAQSHHVRAVGVHLLDLAGRVGQLGEVTRTMSVQSKALGDDLVVTA